MDKIIFTINGESYSITGTEVSPMTSLNDYIRNYLQLHGTKSMCHEGGCGACIVAVSQTHPATKEKHTFAVNSCLVHILSCHQWDITTVEGVGNRKDGYHPIQSRLASFNGTQCGYCTPGWVMNMYSLFEGSRQKLTLGQVENSFGGNLCRCTGYRPILDAFKSFATDVDPKLQSKVHLSKRSHSSPNNPYFIMKNTFQQDLEDLHQMKCTHKCERRCSVVDDDWCVIHDKQDKLLSLGGRTTRWYKAYTLPDVFKVIAREGVDSYALVAGNTGQGVFPREVEPRVFIDISSVETMKDSLVDANLVVGAGMTLTELMQTCRLKSSESDFQYLKGFVDHLDLVAHVPVRNIGTIGGNLAMKHAHAEFPSDIFLLLETVQAYVTMVDHTLSEKTMSMQEFLKTDLKNKIITGVKLPPFSNRNLIRTYKIMPRAQNSLAIVNAGFYFKVDTNNKIETARLIFSALSPTFMHATETEQLLIGLDLYREETLRSALRKLSEELVPADDPPSMSAECRKTIALGLFYKAILSLCPRSQLNPRYVSGASTLQREVSRGTQSFATDKALWPLNEPVPKLEALTQCSGEVKYACDVDSSAREVHVAFVLSTICLGEIEDFDASEALKLPGVVGFFTAKDIPGKNTFTPLDVPWMEAEEELLASKTISYYGQPVALVAAVTKLLALKAADMVKVFYKKSAIKPVLSIEEALVAPDKDKRIREDASVTPTAKGDDTTHVIKGSFSAPSQYHFTMETQSCHVKTTSRGVHVRASTQWPDLVHVATARVLAIDQNKVRVTVSRVGGAYGAKASRSSLIACACSLVAWKLNRPASLVLPLQHNMAAVGKRQRCRADYEASRSSLIACACSLVAWKLDRPASLALPLQHNMAAVGKRQRCRADYELGVNDAGVIQYLTLTYYTECGFNYNDSAGADIAGTLARLYTSTRWKIKGYSVLTDKAGNTWCRAPATTEATAILEHIMEQIAYVTKKDPIAVRIANLAPEHLSITDMIDTLKHDSDYDNRKAEIAKFNAENAWKKKALNLSIMTFPLGYSWNFSVTISVYHGDGTVAVSHSGVEMGQGINTKVAQVCAYTLKIPLDKVSVVGCDSFVSPNAMASNGSMTSDCVAYAAVKACNDMLGRLEPVKRDLGQASWLEIVKAAHEKGVNLQASYMESPLDAPQSYDIYGVCAAEIVLDVLTGQHIVTRVDLLEDVGISISPEIDVGQIEGAFVMGLGLWTSELLAYDPSGRLLTDRTWTYHPPGAKDIPVDFRISFRKNSPNPAGVLRSKATGEPALTLAHAAALALLAASRAARQEFRSDRDWLHVATGEPALTLAHAAALALLAASRAARQEFRSDRDWLHVDTPYNAENILKAISPKIEHFKLK